MSSTQTHPVGARTPSSYCAKAHRLITAWLSRPAMRIAWALVHLPVMAQTAPENLVSPLCLPQVAQHHTIEQLTNNISVCQNQPDWLTYLGIQLNKHKRYADAAEHLERALLLAPHNLHAATAYAIALAGSGDVLSAINLLAHISQRADLPPELRAELQTAQIQLTALPSNTSWLMQRHAAVRLGHDTNLLGTPRLNTLTLTLPTGDITLPVDSSNLPRPGYYVRADMRLHATRTQTSGRRTDISLALHQRNTHSLPSANSTLIEALAESTPARTGAWASLATTQLQTQGGTRYRQTATNAGWMWQPNPTLAYTNCQTKAGLEWQDRKLHSNNLLSSQYTGASATLQCTSAGEAGFSPRNWQIGLKLGHDNPNNAERPGGKQRTSGLHASIHWSNLTMHGEVTHTQDATGYSPLLGNNQIRHSTRSLVRAEYGWQLAEHWQTHAGIEAYHQQSNIKLFNVRSINTYISLRRSW